MKGYKVKGRPINSETWVYLRNFIENGYTFTYNVEDDIVTGMVTQVPKKHWRDWFIREEDKKRQPKIKERLILLEELQTKHERAIESA